MLGSSSTILSQVDINWSLGKVTPSWDLALGQRGMDKAEFDAFTDAIKGVYYQTIGDEKAFMTCCVLTFVTCGMAGVCFFPYAYNLDRKWRKFVNFQLAEKNARHNANGIRFYYERIDTGPHITIKTV